MNCPVCGWIVATRSDGRLRVHRYDGLNHPRCRGSARTPEEARQLADDLGLNRQELVLRTGREAGESR